MDGNSKEIAVLLSKLDQNQVHYPSGPLYKVHQRIKAVLQSDKNELEAIYCLKESHAPGLRLKGIYRSEKTLKSADALENGMNKDHIQFKCAKTATSDNINEMLKQIEEMPKEWTLVQLTPSVNAKEQRSAKGLTKEKNYTNSIHIAVFNCGKKQPKPFLVTVQPPIDRISNQVMELKEEIVSIMSANKDLLAPQRRYTSDAEKLSFVKERSNLNLRLKCLVKNIQDMWLGKWRCLFTGKVFEKDEKLFNDVLNKILTEVDSKYVTEKTTAILKCLILSCGQLRTIEIKRVVETCFPNADHVKLSKKINLLAQNFDNIKRHPVILLVDESLDIFPWEMLDILQDQPVTRMPSLEFTYALFKHHEGSIRNGIKDDISPDDGKFMINPDLDLVNMERRLKSFFNYWLPHWSGLVGVKPSPDKFEKYIQESSIFCYNGHGNGSQFLPSDTIQKIRTNSVICLFGCSSSSYIHLGPQVEMYGAHQMYLLACSPCVVGNLWIVTDTDTDVLSTQFWSIWLPNTKAKNHWKHIDRKKWESTGEVAASETVEEVMFEPELLRALPRAKKSVSQYLTKAACVVRGIPVKIAT